MTFCNILSNFFMFFLHFTFFYELFSKNILKNISQAEFLHLPVYLHKRIKPQFRHIKPNITRYISLSIHISTSINIWQAYIAKYP